MAGPMTRTQLIAVLLPVRGVVGGKSRLTGPDLCPALH